MRISIWMRVAAVLQILFAVGHTLGGTPRVAERGAQEAALFDAMQSFRFDVMGASRSHWAFYQGFSLTIGLYLAITAVLFWQLGDLSRREPTVARPLISTLAVSEIGLALLSFQFFFLLPLMFSIVITFCLVTAVLLSYRVDPISK